MQLAGKRGSEAERQRLLLVTMARVINRMRIVLAVTPAQAEHVRMMAPGLAAFLTLISAPSPSQKEKVGVM
jgi:hypothetical protein